MVHNAWALILVATLATAMHSPAQQSARSGTPTQTNWSAFTQLFDNSVDHDKIVGYSS